MFQWKIFLFRRVNGWYNGRGPGRGASSTASTYPPASRPLSSMSRAVSHNDISVSRPSSSLMSRTLSTSNNDINNSSRPRYDCDHVNSPLIFDHQIFLEKNHVQHSSHQRVLCSPLRDRQILRSWSVLWEPGQVSVCRWWTQDLQIWQTLFLQREGLHSQRHAQVSLKIISLRCILKYLLQTSTSATRERCRGSRTVWASTSCHQHHRTQISQWKVEQWTILIYEQLKCTAATIIAFCQEEPQHARVTEPGGQHQSCLHANCVWLILSLAQFIWELS